MRQLAVALIGIVLLVTAIIFGLNWQGDAGLSALFVSSEVSEKTQPAEPVRPVEVETTAQLSPDAPARPTAISGSDQQIEHESANSKLATKEAVDPEPAGPKAIGPAPANPMPTNSEPSIAKASAVEPSAPSIPSPGPGAMTVYTVHNPNSNPIMVRHIITDTASFRYEFETIVPANSVKEYHLRDMPNVPSPFTGAMSLVSDKPFTAQLVGYDY